MITTRAGMSPRRIHSGVPRPQRRAVYLLLGLEMLHPGIKDMTSAEVTCGAGGGLEETAHPGLLCSTSGDGHPETQGSVLNHDVISPN